MPTSMLTIVVRVKYNNIQNCSINDDTIINRILIIQFIFQIVLFASLWWAKLLPWTASVRCIPKMACFPKLQVENLASYTIFLSFILNIMKSTF